MLHVTSGMFVRAGTDAWAEACEKGRWAEEIRPYTLNRAPAPGGQTVWEEIDSGRV